MARAGGGRVSTHTLRQILTFDTTAGPLDVHVCTCGRMFDAARFEVHTGRAAA